MERVIELFCAGSGVELHDPTRARVDRCFEAVAPGTKLVFTVTGLARLVGIRNEPLLVPAGSRIIVAAGDASTRVVVWRDAVHSVRVGEVQLAHSSGDSGVHAISPRQKQRLVLVRALHAEATKSDRPGSAFAAGVSVAVGGPTQVYTLVKWGQKAKFHVPTTEDELRDLMHRLAVPAEEADDVLLPVWTYVHRFALGATAADALAEVTAAILGVDQALALDETAEIWESVRLEFEGKLLRWPCSCGNKNCLLRHRMAGWGAGSFEHDLWNVAASAVKGPDKTLKTGVFVSGMFFPLLARRENPLGVRVRLADVEYSVCVTPGCVESTILTEDEFGNGFDWLKFAQSVVALQGTPLLSPGGRLWQFMGLLCPGVRDSLLIATASGNSSEAERLLVEGLNAVLNEKPEGGSPPLPNRAVFYEAEYWESAHDARELIRLAKTTILDKGHQIVVFNRFLLHCLFPEDVPAGEQTRNEAGVSTSKERYKACVLCSAELDPRVVRKNSDSRLIMDGASAEIYRLTARYRCGNCKNLYDVNGSSCPLCQAPRPEKTASVWVRTDNYPESLEELYSRELLGYDSDVGD